MKTINKKSRIFEKYLLILIDVMAVIFSYVAAVCLRFKKETNPSTKEEMILVGALILTVALLYSLMTEWNREFFKRGYLVELVAVSKYDLILIIALSSIVFLVQAKYFSRLVFVLFGIFNFILTYLLHIIFKKSVVELYRRSSSVDKVIVVTLSDLAEDIIQNITGNSEWNYDVSGLILLDRDKRPPLDESIGGIPVVAGRNDLIKVTTLLTFDEVFLYVPGYDLGFIKKMIEDFELMGVTCHYSVDMPELDIEGKTSNNFAGYTVMTFALKYTDYRRAFIKKLMDIVGSLIGLVITGILTPFIAIAIKAESKGPVFFSQIRIGKNGRHFRLYKFRSMYIDAEEKKADLLKKNEVKGLMFKMEDDPRITKTGRFLRKYSLDELPQFYNVLKGDMSLVGTRPPTEDEFRQYNMQYKRRLSIKPGITGMWQVSGRSDIDDFDDVVKLDLKYIENWSLMLDIKILLKTVTAVLFKKGAR